MSPRGLFGSWSVARIGRCSSPMTIASRSCPRPGRPRWARRSRLGLQRRSGRSLFELGGNNPRSSRRAPISTLVVRGVLFSAVGIAAASAVDVATADRPRVDRGWLISRLRFRTAACRSVIPALPAHPGRPLVSGSRSPGSRAALDQAREQGGEDDGRRWPRARRAVAGRLVRRADDVRMPARGAVVQAETFAPLLYVPDVRGPRRGDRAPERRAQGLASSIFTTDLRAVRAVHRHRRLRLRDRERRHRPERGGDRRCVRRGEGDRRWPRVRLGRVEGVHAPPDRDRELHERPSARAGHELRRLAAATVGGPRPRATTRYGPPASSPCSRR